MGHQVPTVLSTGVRVPREMRAHRRLKHSKWLLPGSFAPEGEIRFLLGGWIPASSGLCGKSASLCGPHPEPGLEGPSGPLTCRQGCPTGRELLESFSDNAEL